MSKGGEIEDNALTRLEASFTDSRVQCPQLASALTRTDRRGGVGDKGKN